jgi:Na+-transporting NADH:ubiquinone oxidoreductase subunit A
VRVAEFSGVHPAGLVGTHIHTLDPVGRTKTVWHIGYQDVPAIGALIATGKLDMSRVVSLAGPVVNEPRLLRTRQGASVTEITAGQLKDVSAPRRIAGSILNGRTANCEVWGYLGRYHNQISVLEEDTERVFLGWLGSEKKQFSITGAFFPLSMIGFALGLVALAVIPWPAGPWPLLIVLYALCISFASILGFFFALGAFRALTGSETTADIDMTTTTHGSHRAMVPIGSFERVMPLDIMATFLLRALDVDDVENAEALGCLELGEEDLALCSFVAPGKTDFGEALRRNLDIIWMEG